MDNQKFDSVLTAVTRFVFLIVFTFLVGSCGSAEERKASHMEKAQVFFNEGNFPKARVALRNVIKIDPKHAAAYYLLAQVSEKEENWPNAFGFYRQVRDLEPTHRGATARLARFYLAGNQKGQVTEIADELLVKSPEDVLGKVLKASVMFMEGEKEKSLAAAEALVQKESSDSDTAILLAAVFSANEKYQQAIKTLDRGLTADPENIDLLSNLATTYLRMGNVDDAEGVYTRIIDLEPTVFSHREKLARFYQRLKKPEKALALVREAVQLEPDNEDRWKSLLKHSKPADRENVLLEAIEALPHSMALRFLLGQYYEQNQEMPKAREIYEALASEEEASDEGLKAEVKLARLDLADQKQELANSRLEHVLKESPRQPDALVLKGQMALAEKEGAKAVQAFRTVLKDDPTQSAVQAMLGQGHLLSGEFDLAQESFEKAIELNSRQFNAHLALARLSLGKREFAKAQEYIETILKSDPKHLESLGLLFKLQLAQKQWAQAEDTLKRLRDAGGFAYTVDLAEGLLAQARQQWDRALQAFQRAHDSKPETLEPLASIVKVRVYKKELGKAQEYLENILAKQPDHPFVSGLLGSVYAQQRNNVAAKASYRKQTEVNPQWVAPWKDLATLMVVEGKQADAIDVLKQGRKANPNALGLSTSLASLYESMGEVDLAIREYEAILQKNPKVVAVANNLAYLYADKKGDPESLKKALALAKGFETQNPNPLLLDTLAWVNHKMGLDNEALGLLRKAVKAAPKHPLLNYHYGVVALKTGDRSTAKKHITFAVEAGAAFDQLEDARKLLGSLNNPS